jgi:hypothetical protein
MRAHYQIVINSELTKTVYYPTELQNETPIQKLAFGTKVVHVDCIPHPDHENIVEISDDILDEIMIPTFEVPLHLFIENNTLYLGPLVGIFTCGFTPYPLQPIGERSQFFSKLLSLAKTVGVLPFIFGEQHIDWENGIITGLFYQQNHWQTFKVPFPNVIYDRLPNRRSERRLDFKKIKDCLQNDYLIPWYNPGFFNKMDIFELLSQDDSIIEYLPETHSFQSFSMIERMLSDYGHIFIKPQNGSLGLGIYQIIFDKSSNYYYCRYRDKKGENKLTKYKSLEGLAENLFRKKDLSKMIVQQGIHLMRVDQRAIDFRIHTNKDDQGHWAVTAIAAKVAGSGSVTTHLHNGGDIKTIEEIFTVDHDLQLYKQKLIEVTLRVSKALEQQISGIIGEIGFDIGIDRNGDVWVFEANSKPGRSIFKHPRLKEFDYLTRKLSLAFAVFLAEQSIYKPEEVFK